MDMLLKACPFRDDCNPKSTLGRGKSHKCFKICDEYCSYSPATYVCTCNRGKCPDAFVFTKSRLQLICESYDVGTNHFLVFIG